MVAISGHESGGWNPRAVNKSSTRATGLWQINLAAHGERFGTQEELMIPERNAAAAFALWQRGGREEWTSWKNGRWKVYEDQVNAAANRMGL